MNNLHTFLKNHRDFISYTFFGFLASVINIVSFMVIKSTFHAHYMFANTLAWLISVIFGFFTNKSLVFKSEYSTGYALITELIAFSFFRGISLLADSAIMFVCISGLNLSSFTAKVIDQILVGILNYITSRYTFSKDQRQMTRRLRQRRLAHHQQKLAQRKSSR
ncbi:GtrA family protein [Lapidilactobacillus bayanensis]|uniref:GtrA family protein n=1 Tax=Lapidilactobacillus bayanensis TaxID=2485998 RepID=UPI000F79BA1A|nr:GtrA family protein [Lapidilactobacillus bayanensis]